jgi:hypothetical protein
MKAEYPFLLCSWVNDITMGQSQNGPINCKWLIVLNHNSVPADLAHGKAVLDLKP